MTLITSLYLVWGLYIALGLLKGHLSAQSRNRGRYDPKASEQEQKKSVDAVHLIEYWSSIVYSLDWACGIIGAVLTLIYLFKG